MYQDGTGDGVVTPDPTPPDPDHPGDESVETPDFQPPSDGSWIPRDRLNREVAAKRAAEERAEAAEKELRESRQTAAPTPGEPDWAVELQKVRDGEKSFEEYESKRDEWRTKRILERVTSEVQTSNRDSKLTEQINQYESAVPELLDVESDTYKAVAEEYRHNVYDLGLPDNAGTMLAALRSKLGPLGGIKHSAKAKPEADTDTETAGGAGEREESGKPNGKKLFDKLPEGRKDFYRKALDRGGYRNIGEVYSELEFQASRQG